MKNKDSLDLSDEHVKRGVRLIESQIKKVKKGRDQLYVPAGLQRCPFCRPKSKKLLESSRTS